MNHPTLSLACPACGYHELYSRPLPDCPCCGEEWLEARYNIPVAIEGWPAALADRPASLWRYRELLPIWDDANIVSLGEGWTPLIRADNLGLMLGRPHLYLKDERQNPTGSFKDRQASVFASMLKESGITEAVVASTGNVAIAYSAYCARAGIKLWTFITSRVPADKMREIALYGSELVKVSSTYDQTKAIAAHFARTRGLHVDKGVKSIAAKEAMKTVAFEIAEQLPVALTHRGDTTTQGSRTGWQAPDWYIQAVSGGLGPVGVHLGFEQLLEAGLVDRVPKMAHIQVEGCAPMARAYRHHLDSAQAVRHPKTHITTLATGTPGATYTWLKRTADRCGGHFDSVSDEEAYRALHILAKMEGISVEPAAAVALAGLFKMIQQGLIGPDEVVVVNCSGHTFPVEQQILGQAWDRRHEVAGAVAESPREGLTAAISRLDRQTNRVAIIEDNADAARLLRRILQARGGFVIDEARDGPGALAMLRQNPPDLIILDLMLPGIDGFGVLNQLKEDERLAPIPILVVSAKSMTAQERAQLRAQTEGFLQKGTFTDEDLIDRIMIHLNGH
jgi:threonine synthase